MKRAILKFIAETFCTLSTVCGFASELTMWVAEQFSIAGWNCARVADRISRGIRRARSQ